MLSIARTKHPVATETNAHSQDDTNAAERLEAVIAARSAERQASSVALVHIDRELSEIAETLRVAVFSRDAERAAADRATARARRAELIKQRDALVGRLAEQQEDLDLMVTERTRVHEAVYAAIAEQLMPELKARFKTAAAAFAAAYAEASALSAFAHRADTALTDPRNGDIPRAARAIIPPGLLTEAHWFVCRCPDAERFAEWRRDVAAALAL